MNVEPVLISTDTPERNTTFREKMGIEWPALSDPLHELADRYGIPISRRHPKAKAYKDGNGPQAVFWPGLRRRIHKEVVRRQPWNWW